MDMVVFGHGVDATNSIELRYAEKQFLARLPDKIIAVYTLANDIHALINAALESVSKHNLDNNACVLLASNTYLWPAPTTLLHLRKVLVNGASAAYAHGLSHSYPGTNPDYMTVRGLERYVSRLGSQPNHPAQPEIESPLLALTTAGAIRSGNWDANAQWVAAAFVHDFSGYHQSEREDVVPIIPGAVRRVLDVGGGEGGFLTALKSSLKCETHLSEISSAACAIATQRVDQVWQGDFLRAPIDVKFDCITFLDVLEHTEWPVQWLSRAVGMLEPQGCVVASIPNVGHWSVVLDLLEGRWDYAPAGIHCITHLRFFTRYGTEQLMSEAGLKIERIESVQVAAPPWFDVSAMQKNLTIDLESLSSVAYLVRAKPIA